MRRLTSLTSLFLALGISAIGCSDAGDTSTPASKNLSPLGTQLPTCSDSTASGFASGTLTIALVSGVTATLSVNSPALTVNGWTCVDSAGADLTTTRVKKIVVNGSGGNDHFIVDMLGGSFGAVFSSTGGMNVAFTGSGNEFMLRGSANNDKYTVGQSAAGDTYVEITGDTTADVRVVGASALTISSLDGNDTISGQGGTLNATHLLAGVSSTMSASTLPLDLFGGDGNDTITGGAGNDTLHGGDGNDTFKMAATDDGSDKYYGDNDSDTVDYSNRTSPVTVDIGPWAGVTGTAALNNSVAAGLDTKTLTIKVDGGSNIVTTFATPVTPYDVVQQINTAAGATVAWLDVNAKLVLGSSTRTSSSTLQVVGATGSPTAAVDLGLTVATTTVAQTVDADDGLSGENDDVTYTIENVNGGSGNDKLLGSDRSNTLSGNNGDDWFNGGPAAASCGGDVDVLNGGAGNDTFDMGAVHDCGDTVSGGAGTDTVDYQKRSVALTISIGTPNGDDGQSGGTEADNIKDDNEVLLSGSGGDYITGSSKDDEIHGGGGADQIDGAAGNDLIVGDSGNDTLNGGADEDVFDQGTTDTKYTFSNETKHAGSDIINGGAGVDYVDYTQIGAITVTICVDSATSGQGSCGSGNDGPSGGAEGDNIINVESVGGGTAGDSITAGSVGCYLYGNGGNDTLVGGAGDDYLEGGAGNDSIDGAGGIDICAGDGSDTASNTVNCEL